MARQGSSFSSYDEYIASKAWANKRAECVEAWGGTGECALCGNPHEHVHHQNYGQPYGQEDAKRDLIPLCAECHDRQHGRGGHLAKMPTVRITGVDVQELVVEWRRCPSVGGLRYLSADGVTIEIVAPVMALLAAGVDLFASVLTAKEPGRRLEIADG